MTAFEAFDPFAPGAIAGVRGLTDDELVTTARDLEEQFGRQLDALRMTIAAEVEHRSRRALGADGLAAKHGCRNGVELLERTTGASVVTARRRARLGERFRPGESLSGEPLPARFPLVAEAVESGRATLDEAAALTDELAACAPRVGIEQLRAAERGLVESLGTTTVECLRLQAEVWCAVIDPDGIEPDEEAALARRGVRLGRARDGLIPITGHLIPQVAAQLQQLFNAYLSPRTGPAFADLTAPVDDEGAPLVDETRTPDQQRHDVLGGILAAAGRDPETPKVGGAHPTVLVSVRREDLESGTGAGWIDGVDIPVSMATARQIACCGGTQTVVLGDEGEVISLYSPNRVFTAAQRTVIVNRDGGCSVPGCRVPAMWCEIHHVLPAAHGGDTDVSNGVLLCWFHHRTIESSGWKVRMTRGVPEFQPPPWIDVHRRWVPSTRSRTRIAARLESSLRRD